MPLIIFKRSTKNQLDTIASLGKLIPNEPYFLYDLNTIAVATSKNDYIIIYNFLEDAIPIEKGGTGANNREQAINNLLPSQSTHTQNYILQSDGNNVSWVNPFTFFLSTEQIVVREVPIGVIDNNNTDFFFQRQPILGTEMIFLNGLLQEEHEDYNILSDEVPICIRFTSPPIIGDRIRISYISLI